MTGQNPFFWVAQGAAAVGFMVMFWSNYSINRKVTITGRGVSSLLFTLEYVILGMWSAAGVSGINALRGTALRFQ